MKTETLFYALSDVTRRQVLSLLIARGECCVCNLYETLNHSQPKISRHLAVSREAQLVQARRAGVWVHYSVNPALPEWVHAILAAMARGERAIASDEGKGRRAVPAKPIIRRRTHV